MTEGSDVLWIYRHAAEFTERGVVRALSNTNRPINTFASGPPELVEYDLCLGLVVDTHAASISRRLESK